MNLFHTSCFWTLVLVMLCLSEALPVKENDSENPGKVTKRKIRKKIAVKKEVVETSPEVSEASVEGEQSLKKNVEATATGGDPMDRGLRALESITNRFQKKAPEIDRLARFIFDGLGESGSFGSYGSGSSSDSKTGNLLNLNIDSARVMQGLFSPEWAAIHIGENLLEAFSASIGYIIAGAIYSATQGRSNDGYSNSDSGGLFGGFGLENLFSPFSNTQTFRDVGGSSSPTSSYESTQSIPASYGAPIAPVSTYRSQSDYEASKRVKRGPFSGLADTLSPIFKIFKSRGDDDRYASPGSVPLEFNDYEIAVGSDNNEIIYKTPSQLVKQQSTIVHTPYISARTVAQEQNQGDYEDQSVGASEMILDVDKMSVSQIQELLDDAEEGGVDGGILDQLTAEQKYKMYQKAKSALVAVTAAENAAKHGVYDAPVKTFEESFIPDDQQLVEDPNKAFKKRRRVVRGKGQSGAMPRSLELVDESGNEQQEVVQRKNIMAQYHAIKNKQEE